EDLRPEHFAPCAIAPLVVSHEDFPALVEMKDSSALNKLTSRIVVASLHKGMGGEFPKLRYVSTIAKNIVEAEAFGRIWQRFAEDGADFARKVVNSMEGHWGREPLSAHSIFEDGIQRTVVERVREMTDRMVQEARTDEMRVLAEHIKALVAAYHLAIMLPDGKFVTCSAWSWASYSFKGGRASPSPLSLHVERDWASREFLIEYYKAIGGTEEAVEEKIIELMGQGKESDDLAAILLGTEKGRERVVPKKAVIVEQPRAGSMTRYSGNPILQPIKDHSWESKYVLNAGVIRLDGKVYLVYRAFGDDEISRLGLAVSRDGFRFTQRLDKPIFTPANSSEVRGCEDPRLVFMGGRVFMTYTAYDGTVAQIALASITKDDFINFRWERWERHGLVFPGYTDKDAAMFPAQFNGKFAMLHRVDPHIWITFSEHLSCPWPRQEHKILAGATAGMMWDGLKIGAGAQPLKTRYGWLLITHGVDYARVYRLGIMLLDLEDPTKLIYRSPNFVLEPEASCEVGKEGECWVHNVVFTCGALPLYDSREDLAAEDELIVYYGASDTVISIAVAKVGDMIPAQYRS
ncbi:MAG: glycosidase, partial [Chloroflexi bacterium]|nr:glycosidase [Chloroflexota bacterium]